MSKIIYTNKDNKVPGGNISGKCCDLGPVGFPCRIPDCHQSGGFPLNPDCMISQYRTGLPLSTHFNP